MTPVDQEFVHDPANSVYGDCQRASIASLLDLPLSEVPHFLHDNCEPPEFYERIQRFCRSRGFIHVELDELPQAYGDDGDLHHLIYGPSPRGFVAWHAVVGRNGEVIHDPHPSKAGLAGDPSGWRFAFLVKA